VPGGVDEILQVLAGRAQDEAPGIFAMPFRVQPEVQCDGPRLAAAPGAAIADDIGGALDESRLRPRLRFDDLDVHPGQCSCSINLPFLPSARPGPPPYFACQSSRLISAGAFLVGGWFSQSMLDLHLLPVDHEPEELCLHRRGLNRRPHLTDAERVGPVLVEFPGKAVDGHLVPFCLFGTEFGEACGNLNLS